MIKLATLKETLDDMKSGVYDFTKDGKCTGCGSCCSNLLPMTKKEVDEIRRYVKKNNICEIHYLFPIATPVLNMTCPFLDLSKGKDKCRIYSVRPSVCRGFSCNKEVRDKSKIQFGAGNIRIINVREEFFEE